jgi:subtilisin family serine protease
MKLQLLTTLALGAIAASAAAQHNSTAWGESIHRQWTTYLEANPDVKYNNTAILVRFDSDKSEAYKANVRALVGDGWLEKYTLVPGLELIHVRGSIEDAVARVKPFVMYAEPDYVCHTVDTLPNDPSFNQEWGLNNTGQTTNGDPGTAGSDIRAPRAWDFFTGDPNFVIADIDTGLQLNHPDFAGNVWVNPGEIPGNGVDDDGDGYIDDVNGWNFYTPNNDPSDQNGHGTHTAGTIGARGNNGVGVTGVNWQCKIMPIRAFSPTGSGSVSICVSCIQFAVLKGVKVSSNSWGSSTFNVQSLHDAIANAAAIGHIFVCAAGNNAQNNDTVGFYPASWSLDNMIVVAATTNEDLRASFSNYGPNTVHLGAPGNNVYSTWFGSSYAFDSGTSMATPHVAGAVAMVWGLNPSFTYQQVKYRILSTARPIASLHGNTVTGGILNLAEAVAPGSTMAGVNYCSGNVGDPTVTTACPCANQGSPGFGCKNSTDYAGARLNSAGVPALDNVVFTTTGEISTATSIVLQGDGNVATGLVFGDGLLCAFGNLKRLYTKTAVNGSITAPQPGDLSVKAQSAALGDTILPGSTRYYQVYYRDSNLVFCAPGYNSTNAQQIGW